MDKLGCGPATRPILRKEKKKVKGEIDRVKQAEKKKRRLEKALATSAAIRSELEKKKQKKIEEQRRLDEEGAAIAESVALLVLGGEDSDCRDPTILNGCGGLNILSDTVTATALPVDYPCWELYSFNSIGHASDGYRSGFRCDVPEIGWGFPAALSGMHPQKPYVKETGQGPRLLASIAPAAQATSAIEVADDLDGGMITSRGTARYLLDTMVGGNYT